MSISNPYPPHLGTRQKLFAALGFIGLLLLILVTFGVDQLNTDFVLAGSLVLIAVGVSGFAWFTFKTTSPGIRNDGIWFSSWMSRGLMAWACGLAITFFYVVLYWFPAYLGLGQGEAENTHLIGLFDSLSFWFKGQPSSQWFVYGVFYTLGILAFGVRFILKYRHNKYQVWRTISVMFFQLGFAFLLPELLLRLNYPYFDLKNMWPLNYYFFDEWSVKGFLSSGNLGLLMFLFGIAMIFLISPVLTYFYGKRWYCSWVCGCGGLAETVGDPFRQLSDKSLRAWKVERWMIHSVLLFSIIMTVGVVYSYLHSNPSGYWLDKYVLTGLVGILALAAGGLYFFKSSWFKQFDKKAIHIFLGVSGLVFILLVASTLTGHGQGLFINSYTLRSVYGFLIGAAFSGVIGVGFYPLMGSRVWCRFGCPMAAILGIQQKIFSRFRITTNGGQCISCGNCSTYCEMGIDVRAYAQRGQDIVRASCVGCGICSAVCPRGVLRLENGTFDLFSKAEEKRVPVFDKEL